MRIRAAFGSLIALALLAPTFALAAFVDASAAAKAQVASLSQQQLDSFNTKVFTDAHLAGKIIGFDRSEIDQIKAQLHALQLENAQLRAQINGQPVAAVTAPTSLEARVATLEKSLGGLQSTLMTVVQMLTSLLTKLG